MPSWTFAELGRHSALCRAVGPVLALGHTFGKDIRGQWARPLHAPYLVRTLARSPACSQPIRKYGSSSPIVPFTPISDCSASCGPMHVTLPPQQDCAWSRLTQSGVQSCCIWAGTAHLKLHTNDMAAYHRRLLHLLPLLLVLLAVLPLRLLPPRLLQFPLQPLPPLLLLLLLLTSPNSRCRPISRAPYRPRRLLRRGSL